MAVRVQQQDFDIGAEISRLTSGRQDIGALVTFTGLVRDNSAAPKDSAALKTMTLEHYPGMTEAELERVEAEAKKRWSLQASLIIHRYGELRPGL